MKKASAFSVFSGKASNERKAKRMETPTGPADTSSTSSNFKRADHTPVGRGKKLLNSIRASVRGSGQKVKPSTLRVKGDSPHVAIDSGRQVSLTSLKSVGNAENAKETESAPRRPPVDRTTKPTLSKSSLRSANDNNAATTAVAEQTSSGKKTKKSPTTISKQISQPEISDHAPSVTSTAKKTNKTPNQGQVSWLPMLPPAVTANGKSTKRQLDLPEEAGPSSKKKRKSTGPKTPMGRNAGEDGGGDAPASVGMVSRRVPYMYDSSEEASRMFDVLIHPVQADKFFRELWEQKPLLVRRHTPEYNSGWFSTAEFDRILRQENIQYGVNLDITSYVDDKRETHNPVGRAYGPVVWDYYQKGCSVRFLNPQTYSRNVWKILSVLQEFFNCSVGANVYLTPPGTQGFAPHYDDIEAFVIQLEGKKHWKLYNPRSDEETLPRFSSKNLSRDDVGTPILDVVLEAGDLLYFPRGVVHEACANEDVHSLHVTFSCYQRNTWGDLLEKMVPQALAMAIEENVEFRKGLPRDYLSYMGIVHQDKESPQRQKFQKTVEDLVRSMVNYLPLDAACDQMGKQAIHDALPPVLTQREKSCSINGAGERWVASESQVRGIIELEPDTRVRLIRHGVIRMLTEEDEVRIYHSLENARVYHGNTPQYIEITSEAAPAVEYLIDVYPEFVPIDGLPLEHLQEKLDIANLLYDKGMLMTEGPLQTMYDEGTDSDDDENGS